MADRAVEKKSFLHAIAAAISTIVHPIALPLVTLVVVTDGATGQLSEGLTLAGAALLLTSVPVGALVAWQVARGHWSDLDVSVRKQRYLLYPVGIACAVLLIGVYVLLRAPGPAMASVLALTLAQTVNGAINFAYKVSGHAATASACAALLWMYAPGWGLPVAIAAALVGWSRVELGRHTTGQVVLGWAVGVASALTLYVFYPA
jgi:membrane-associated phospholipid phosphatase